MDMPYRALVLFLALGVFIAACAPLKEPKDQNGIINHACRMSGLKDRSISVAGVEVPLGKLAPGQLFKIGSVTYTGEQAEKLAESAQLLEQVRLMNCAVLASNSPKAYELLTKGYDAVNTYFTNLRQATTPQEGLEAASKAKDIASKIKQESNTELSPIEEKQAPSTGQTSQTLLDGNPATIEERLTILSHLLARMLLDSDLTKHRIDQIQKYLINLQPLQNNGFRKVDTIDIVGFESGAAHLPAHYRDKISAEFRSAVLATPSDKSIIVFIMGFADSRGNVQTNLRLGMARAESIRGLITRQANVRQFYAIALSGGVTSAPEGRHVKVLITST